MKTKNESHRNDKTDLDLLPRYSGRVVTELLMRHIQHIR